MPKPSTELHTLPAKAVLSAETLEKFINNQTKELELRSQELVLQSQKDKNSFDFGKSALLVKAQDRKENRDHQYKQRQQTYIFAGFAGIMVIGLVVYALHLNKDVFAVEIVKAIVFILTGGVGGYGLARSKASQEPPQSKTDDR